MHARMHMNRREKDYITSLGKKNRATSKLEKRTEKEEVKAPRDRNIHPKNWLSLLENSAENSNFPQRDCLRTRELSIL